MTVQGLQSELTRLPVKLVVFHSDSTNLYRLYTRGPQTPNGLSNLAGDPFRPPFARRRWVLQGKTLIQHGGHIS